MTRHNHQPPSPANSAAPTGSARPFPPRGPAAARPCLSAIIGAPFCNRRRTSEAVMFARMILYPVVILMMLGIFGSTPADAGDTRPAYCAGRWYPSQPDELRNTIQALLDAADDPALPKKPRALIVPHAGYRFSAPVAAQAYHTIENRDYRRVIILAFSHRNASRYRGIDLPRDLAACETPLGHVPLDRPICDKLLQSPLFAPHDNIDAGEHSLELQLPFLRYLLPDAKIIPLLVGRMEEDDYTAAAKALLEVIDNQTLIVASTDFTHYGPDFGYVPFREDIPDNLRKLADSSTAALNQADYDGFVDHLEDADDTICGRNPVRLLLRILAMQGGAQGKRVGFDTSGNLTGDWTNSVSYHSYVFTDRPDRLAADERRILLKLARDTAAAHLSDDPLPAPDSGSLPERLRADGGCFVTFKNRGKLRGCIGNMTAREPLYQSVIHNAVAACQDPRFTKDPIRADELGEIDIEISYLTPMKRVKLPSEVVVGRDGILIVGQGRRGVLLPQVAYERGWTREVFLEQTCHKAGLPGGSWKDRKTEIYTFEAEVFRETNE